MKLQEILDTNKGFTLLELVIVIAIIVVILGGAGFVQGAIIAESNRKSKSTEIIQSMRVQQIRSITNYKNDNWGVYVDEDPSGNDDKFVLFKGNSYAARDNSFDIIIDLPDIISITDISLNGGGADIVFERITGETSDYGSFTLTDNEGNNTIVSINSFGVIDTN